MSSITAQQIKLDLELVPKEKRLEIGKSNERLNPGKKQREPTFQIVLDALALTPCYSAFLTTADVAEVYMYQLWDSIHKYKNSYRFRMDKKKKFDLNFEIFRDIFQICPRVRGQNFDALPTDEDIVSFFKELGHTREIKTITDIILWGMYYKKNMDYVELLWEDFTYQIDNRASPEEPTRKSKRIKRPTKKYSDAPTTGVVIRETRVKSLSKKKEKMTIEKGKGIDLLSEVSLTEEAQYEEVRKKSLKDFHKTHPSGSGTVTKIAPSAAKIKPSVTNEGTGAKSGVPYVAEEELTENEAESWGKDEDDINNDHELSSEGNDQERDSGDDNTQSDSEKGSDSEHKTDENESGSESDQEENEEEDQTDEEEKNDEFVKTPSNDTDDEDETKIKYKAEGDEDEGMDYTTNQLDDNVDVRMNEPDNIVMKG
ncbi:hypothetical protein Tco_0149200 [Tanacetum coccineum]